MCEYDPNNPHAHEVVVTIPEGIVLFYNAPGKEKRTNICIDGCLVDEIIFLWRLGIETTSCCCGHQGKFPAHIMVLGAAIWKMQFLSYEHRQRNDTICMDYFIPKTQS